MEMRKAFDEQINKNLSCINKIDVAIDHRIGLENEYFIIDKDKNPVTQSFRDSILQGELFFKKELGVSQIELNTIPISIEQGHEEVLHFIKEQENAIVKKAKKFGCSVIRMGFYPGNLDDIQATYDPEHNQKILNVYEKMRKDYFDCYIGDVNIGSRMHELISGCQASELNMEVDLDRAIPVLNKTYEMSPLFIALSANSPIVNYSNSGYLEIRNIIWEKGYELRTFDKYCNDDSYRTYFPRDYYDNINQYWADVNSQIHIKHDECNAFINNQKMFWRLARLKLFNSKCILETRFMSMQPTCEEEIAIHMALYAMLMLSVEEKKDLLPISFVKENFRRTTRYGVDTQLYDYENGTNKIKERYVCSMLEECLEKIVKYWSKISLNTAILIEDIFHKRLEKGPAALEQIEFFKTHTIEELMEHYAIKV